VDFYGKGRTGTVVKTLFTEVKMTLTMVFKIAFTFRSGAALLALPDHRPLGR
jgi:hypothetical protein